MLTRPDAPRGGRELAELVERLRPYRRMFTAGGVGLAVAGAVAGAYFLISGGLAGLRVGRAPSTPVAAADGLPPVAGADGPAVTVLRPTPSPAPPPSPAPRRGAAAGTQATPVPPASPSAAAASAAPVGRSAAPTAAAPLPPVGSASPTPSPSVSTSPKPTPAAPATGDSPD